MDWELLSEFGHRGLLGRTLSKYSSSGVYVEPFKLEAAASRLLDWWKTQSDQDIDLEAIKRFVHLLLYRIRNRGGISHEFLRKFREEKQSSWELNWQKDERHYLNPKYGPKSRYPRMLATQPSSNPTLDSTYTKTRNWFHIYYLKHFSHILNSPNFLNEFYAELFKLLEQTEIVDVVAGSKINTYALRPQALMASPHALSYRCTACEHQVHTTRESYDLSGGHCLEYQCKEGKYVQVPEEESIQNYYAQVYNRERIPRIYAHDHTGLLDREKREEVEKSFKERSRPDAYNVLLATSTLEMGIDIGNLNAAFNSSVPPRPANFLQRVGRAGRKSGSALVVNFAKADPHDLFYYLEPMEMMAGDVNVPGCFLGARDIMTRHFFAFCIDSWTHADPMNHSIPPQLRTVLSKGAKERQHFYHLILNFVDDNQEGLLEAFGTMYQKEKDPQVDLVLQELEQYIAHGTLREKVLHSFENVQKEIEDLQQQRTDIFAEIKRRKLAEKDEERVNLESHALSLSRLQKAIRERMTLEHMTNTGLLPNYAFPETGVKLNARILRAASPNLDTKVRRTELEVVRSARSAIKELAPNNSFYTQGFKLPIIGFNTYNWGDKKYKDEYRFCSRCDHIDRAAASTNHNCPKCEDESWSSDTNRHEMLRLSAVQSFVHEREAGIEDSSEERNQVMYAKTRHFDFDASSSKGAWVIENAHFGFEFMGRVDYKETNLGLHNIKHARNLTINGENRATHGFVTCRHCGKSSSDFNMEQKLNKNYSFHFPYCKHKDRRYLDDSDDVFEELFLYREFRTEALKIRLPIYEVDSEAKVQMFKAGIELGLRQFYHGNPDHIRIERYKEFNTNSQRFQQYLVLMDEIPGGTGYLGRLFDTGQMSDLLRLAYERIRDCTCKAQGQDGCYRCIFSYGNQYIREQLSRERAEQMFAKIIDNLKGWKQEGTLSKMPEDGQLEESDLEERFVLIMKKLCGSKLKPNWTWTKKKDDKDNYHYELHCVEEDIEQRFSLQPQYEVPGFAFKPRVDFLMSCNYVRLGKEKWEAEQLAALPEILIELDGHQYHATGQHRRFAKDVQKRIAFAESGRHLSWTFTWEDLEKMDEVIEHGDDARFKPDALHKRYKKTMSSKARQNLSAIWKKQGFSELELAKTNFTRFLQCLIEVAPNPDLRHKFIAQQLSYFQQGLFLPSYELSQQEEYLSFAELRDKEQFIKSSEAMKKGFSGLTVLDPGNLVAATRTSLSYDPLTFGYSLSIIQQEDDLPIADWQSFWHWFNLMQFGQYFEPIEEIAFEEQEEEFCYEEKYHPLLRDLQSRGIAFDPDGDFALMKDGEVVASADLGFLEQKIVIEPFSEEDEANFEAAGYTVYTFETFKIDFLL